MELATQNHLTTLRNLLEFRLNELRAEVHASELTHGQTASQRTREVGDSKDEAVEQQFANLDNVQEQRDVDEMALVIAALDRLNGGTYGDCADCGEPIALARLLVQPAAPCCAPCQAAREHELERAKG